MPTIEANYGIQNEETSNDNDFPWVIKKRNIDALVAIESIKQQGR